MRVFISWSGDRSHKIACILRDWLPSVIQSISPYVSSEDIDKGARWSGDIAKELEQADYGVICITRENLAAPWVHFEAGALSKSIDQARVTPLLVDVKRSEIIGPLLQFQSVLFEQEEMRKLAASINTSMSEKNRLSPEKLDESVEVWWHRLEEQFRAILSSHPVQDLPPDTNNDKSRILEEILELSRQQQKILTNPDVLLPRQYIRSAIETRLNRRTSDVHYELEMDLAQLQHVLDSASEPSKEIITAIEICKHAQMRLRHHLLERKRSARWQTFMSDVSESKSDADASH